MIHGAAVPIETSYSQAGAQFASLLDQVTDDQEVAIVRRRGKEDVAMISAAELRSFFETAHVLRSPKNAQRLLAAIQRARGNSGVRASVEQRRDQVGLTEE